MNTKTNSLDFYKTNHRGNEACPRTTDSPRTLSVLLYLYAALEFSHLSFRSSHLNHRSKYKLVPSQETRGRQCIARRLNMPAARVPLYENTTKAEMNVLTGDQCLL